MGPQYPNAGAPELLQIEDARLRGTRSGQISPVWASYVLPIRWADDEGLDDLTAYVRSLPDWVEAIVVDGSPATLFERHRAAWAPFARHLRPDPALETPMGKVGGVLTGVREASSEAVVIADDDVRYDEPSLRRVVQLLGLADCVRPQNYFDPVPWHALWDTARTLLNRSVGADFPGTLAIRRRSLLRAGGYDGDAIFENLELMRTIRAAGGSVLSPLDLYVARRAPTTEHFLSQRVRQAYDDFAIPARMATWLGILPALGVAVTRGRWRAIASAAVGTAVLAELGRRRAGGREHFSPASSLLAPGWVLERAACSWLAVRERLTRGGVRYGDGVVPRAASSTRRLRRRFARRDRAVDGNGLPARRPETDQLVGAVAEGLPARPPAPT